MSRRYAARLMIPVLSLSLTNLVCHAQSPAVPAQPTYGVAISTDHAQSVVAASIEEARKNNWKMAIAIVDTGGHLVHFVRMQDTQIGSIELSIEKARTAALFRRPTKSFQDNIAAGGDGWRLLRAPGITPLEGGIPILSDGKVIGAIGVSGGTGAQDAQVAKAGANPA
ncbi:heme-binding protein [Chitinivorax sp. B]|uniref:GlcG/HbpS family heme-binding protein n=1 Tax=Chitinivorax sp. B TaxID=2502235 RepID=UPI0010F76F3E|nr:heme-binding protein [Chitinivorax sp. B]